MRDIHFISLPINIKRVVFLSIVGDKLYQVICGLLALIELSDVNYGDITTTMTNHYNCIEL